MRVKLVCLAAMLAPLAAGAVDWSPDTARILGDPAYLPLAGQVYSEFSYSYSANLYNYRGSTAPDAVTNSWDRSGNSLVPYLSYGITDDISLSADLGWSNLRSEDTYIAEYLVFPHSTGTPGTVGYQPPPPRGFPRLVRVQRQISRYSVGASNPHFGADWRAIDQRTAPVNLDLSISYAPDIFSARDPGGHTTGTTALGGQQSTVQAAVSRETRFLTLLGYAAFTYTGRRDIIQPGQIETLRTGGHPEYGLGVETQARLLPWLALNSGVTATKSVQYDEIYVTGSSRNANTLKPGGTLSPYAGLVFPFLGGRAAGEMRYQHDFTGDEKVDFWYGGEGRYSDNESNYYTARLRFVFF